MTTVDDATRARLRAAEAALHEVLTSVATDTLARMDRRCPYRACGDRCTFAGGCRNQRRKGDGSDGAPTCVGDHRLRRRDG
jgi:hypothetical protein